MENVEWVPPLSTETCWEKKKSKIDSSSVGSEFVGLFALDSEGARRKWRNFAIFGWKSVKKRNEINQLLNLNYQQKRRLISRRWFLIVNLSPPIRTMVWKRLLLKVSFYIFFVMKKFTKWQLLIRSRTKDCLSYSSLNWTRRS